MFSGLPLRTTSTTTEEVTMPVVGAAAQPSATSPGVDEAGHVAGQGQVHEVGLLSRLHGAALVSGGP